LQALRDRGLIDSPDKFGKQFKFATGEHPPAIEFYLNHATSP